MPPAPFTESRIALVVDDDGTTRALAAAALARQGFQVLRAADAQSALTQAAQRPVRFFMVDVQMPGEDGFWLCRQLRALEPYRRTPILMMTGYDDVSAIDAAFQSGATDFIAKPLNLPLLAHRVRFIMKTADLIDEVEENRRTLDEALDLAQLGHWAFDLDKRSLWLSPSAQRQFGLSGPDLSESEYFRNIHPEDRASVVSTLARLGLAQRQVSWDMRWFAPGGNERAVHVVARVNLGADDAVVGWVGSVQDVTERQRASETLRLWSRVVESTGEGMLIADAALRPVQINQAYSTITDRTLADLQSDPSHFFDVQFHERILPELLASGRWQGERRAWRGTGDECDLWVNVCVLRDAAGRLTHYVAMLSDITAIKRSQRKLDYMARHDTLTGLPNRAALNGHLDELIARGTTPPTPLAVLYVDLDRFKNVNDSLGHHVGDKLLCALVGRLRNLVGKDTMIGRLGGDEFMLVLADDPSLANACTVSQAIIDVLAEPFALEGYRFVIGASIGICLYPRDGQSVEELVKNADTAMYRAKDQGRNRYEVYSEQMSAAILDRLALEGEMRTALLRSEFELFYQPKVDLRSGRIIGAEALVRWRHPEKGLLLPGRFIALAEESGLVVELGLWVLQSAARQMRNWQRQGLPISHVAINVAGQQIWHPGFVAQFEQVLAQTGLSPSALEVEITETLIMLDADHQRTVAQLDALRQLGLTLAIDDFGTGHSSLAYLKRLPVSVLKIDKAFVHDLGSDRDDEAIVRAIIAMTRHLGLATVAEGIETEGQLRWLQEAGCDVGQGYLFARPMASADFERLVLEQPRTPHCPEPIFSESSE